MSAGEWEGAKSSLLKECGVTQRSVEDNNGRCGPEKCPMTQTSKVEDFSGRNSGQKAERRGNQDRSPDLWAVE